MPRCQNKHEPGRWSNATSADLSNFKHTPCIYVFQSKNSLIRTAFCYVSLEKIFKLFIMPLCTKRIFSSFLSRYEKNLRCWSGFPRPSSCPAPPSSWASCSQNSGASFQSKFIFLFIKHALPKALYRIQGSISEVSLSSCWLRTDFKLHSEFRSQLPK